MTKETNDEIFEKLEKTFGTPCPPELKKKLAEKLYEIRSYTPKVGVFGKTGVGKSSLCNALFGQDICEISDIKACTREPKEVLLSLGTGGLKLIDVPGVGESSERDKEYHELYQNLLPELDLMFWVFKGDDRAASSDETFFKNIIRPYINAGKPFLAVINQADKIEPFREWNEKERKPGAKQATNIEAKRAHIAGLFHIPMNKVLAISANERYGLMELVDSIVHELPNEQKLVVLEKIKAADDAGILAAQVKAAEAQAAVQLEKAKAETTRIQLEKAQQEIEAKALTEANEVEKLKLAIEQQRLEMEKMKLKAEQDKTVREAEERERHAREIAEERSRNRNVSSSAQAEANKGVFDTVVSFAKSVWSGFKSLFSW
jgi:predicted GTPase